MRTKRKETLSCLKTWQRYWRAVAFNLNTNFLFYFQILFGISGMLRRAGYKALSTRWSRIVGTRHVLMETNHLSLKSLKLWTKAQRAQAKCMFVGLKWLDARSQKQNGFRSIGCQVMVMPWFGRGERLVTQGAQNWANELQGSTYCNPMVLCQYQGRQRSPLRDHQNLRNSTSHTQSLSHILTVSSCFFSHIRTLDNTESQNNYWKGVQRPNQLEESKSK